MKINPFYLKGAIAIMALALFANGTALAQSGGGYDLSWFTIDGGGGTSSGGAFTLSGTIGQPDAGVMAGGDYLLSGGFWPGTRWCIVDLIDLYQFTTFWLMSTPGLPGDFDNSGQIDLYDYNQLATYWLRLCPDKWPWW